MVAPPQRAIDWDDPSWDQAWDELDAAAPLPRSAATRADAVRRPVAAPQAVRGAARQLLPFRLRRAPLLCALAVLGLLSWIVVPPAMAAWHVLGAVQRADGRSLAAVVDWPALEQDMLMRLRMAAGPAEDTDIMATMVDNTAARLATPRGMAELLRLQPALVGMHGVGERMALLYDVSTAGLRELRLELRSPDSMESAGPVLVLAARDTLGLDWRVVGVELPEDHDRISAAPESTPLASEEEDNAQEW